jgi:hypothetical protein
MPPMQRPPQQKFRRFLSRESAASRKSQDSLRLVASSLLVTVLPAFMA